MGRFISLEGLSGVGKSVVSKVLATRLHAKLMRTVPRQFAGLRNVLDASRDIEARFCFFLSAVFYASGEINRVLQSGRTVVVESYLYRTIAFHRGMGSRLEISLPEEVIMPTDVFLLTCEEEERQRRRTAAQKRNSYWDELAEANSSQIRQEYEGFDTTIVDSTRRSPEEVAEFIRTILG